MRSAKLTPAARTAIRTSPAPTTGSGRSWTFSTSGPPVCVNTTALMRRTYSPTRWPRVPLLYRGPRQGSRTPPGLAESQVLDLVADHVFPPAEVRFVLGPPAAEAGATADRVAVALTGTSP